MIECPIKYRRQLIQDLEDKITIITNTEKDHEVKTAKINNYKYQINGLTQDINDILSGKRDYDSTKMIDNEMIRLDKSIKRSQNEPKRMRLEDIRISKLPWYKKIFHLQFDNGLI